MCIRDRCQNVLCIDSRGMQDQKRLAVRRESQRIRRRDFRGPCYEFGLAAADRDRIDANRNRRRSEDKLVIAEPDRGVTLAVCGDPAQVFALETVSYTHLRAHETPEHLVCRLLL